MFKMRVSTAMLTCRVFCILILFVECYAAQAINTANITSTVYLTNTHLITASSTIEVVVEETTTIVSAMIETVSDISTATMVIYTTTTIPAKRNYATIPVERFLQDHDNRQKIQITGEIGTGHVESNNSAGWLKSGSDSLLSKNRYQEHGAVARQISSVNIVTVTVIVDVTSAATTTTLTELTTSIVRITLLRTQTSFANADHTVSLTSTIVEMLRPPTTQTQVITTTISTEETTSTGRSTVSSTTANIIPGPHTTSSTVLSTSTIVGIAVGLSGGAIVLLSIAYVLWRLRRRRRGDGLEFPIDAVPNEGLPRSRIKTQMAADPSKRAPIGSTTDNGPYTRRPKYSHGSSGDITLHSGQTTRSTKSELKWSATVRQ